MKAADAAVAMFLLVLATVALPGALHLLITLIKDRRK